MKKYNYHQLKIRKCTGVSGYYLIESKTNLICSLVFASLEEIKLKKERMINGESGFKEFDELFYK